jgi:hypoxanthine phosphoribosyltransferase
MTNKVAVLSPKEALYGKILFTEAEVDARIEEMAADIIRTYNGTNTLFVSLLNGAQPFTAKLMFAIQSQDAYFHPNVQSMIISRYGPNREPGETRVVTDLPPEYRDLTKWNVVVLEDLVDKGGTLEFATKHLLKCGAKTVDCIVLVKKLKKSPINTKIKMFGFETADVWLTGMGMDDERLAREGNRWASFISVALSE